MDYDTQSKELGVELVIRTRGYRITLDVPEGDIRVSKSDSRDWHIAFRRRRCGT